MKKGDLVMCIENRYDCNIKNSIYKILKISKYYNEIVISREPDMETINNSCVYLLNAKDEQDHKDHFVFSDHFISIKEARKLKLKKLNEIG